MEVEHPEEMTTEEFIHVFQASLGVFLSAILYVRINGLRTFSKMTSFDFAVTIAIGSILGASAVKTNGNPVPGLFAVACLLLFQRLVARLRLTTPLDQVLSNKPLCLMWQGEILEENLSASRVSEDDLFAKLREANALNLESVQAVVLETSGDIAVLHGGDELSDRILCDVEGIPDE